MTDEIKMAECKHCKSTIRYDVTKCPQCGGGLPTNYKPPLTFATASLGIAWWIICTAVVLFLFSLIF